MLFVLQIVPDEFHPSTYIIFVIFSPHVSHMRYANFLTLSLDTFQDADEDPNVGHGVSQIQLMCRKRCRGSSASYQEFGSTFLVTDVTGGESAPRMFLTFSYKCASCLALSYVPRNLRRLANSNFRSLQLQ